MDEQRLKIEVVPIGEEVQSILKQLPKSKAPRIDGMIVEVLLAYWSFLQSDYLAMIHQFWDTRILAHQTIVKVLKLVSKKADKRQLKDWRPLTMMPIIYKLIAKLLAKQFSPYNVVIISIQ